MTQKERNMDMNDREKLIQQYRMHFLAKEAYHAIMRSKEAEKRQQEAGRESNEDHT